MHSNARVNQYMRSQATAHWDSLSLLNHITFQFSTGISFHLLYFAKLKLPFCSWVSCVFLSFEQLISFPVREFNVKSAVSMFVPGKIVLPSEGKLRQFSLETMLQLEQTKRRPPRWITQRGAFGPFSAKIRRLFLNFKIQVTKPPFE